MTTATAVSIILALGIQAGRPIQSFHNAPAPKAESDRPATASVTVTLERATPVWLELGQDITTANPVLRPGNRFDLKVARAVAAGGYTAVPAGAPALGVITAVERGGSDRVAAKIVSMDVEGRVVPLDATFEVEGEAAGGGRVLLKAGDRLQAYVVADTAVTVPANRAAPDEDIKVLSVSAPNPR